MALLKLVLIYLHPAIRCLLQTVNYLNFTNNFLLKVEVRAHQLYLGKALQ